MTRFPFRLTLNLDVARLAQRFRGEDAHPLILRLNPVIVSDGGDADSNSYSHQAKSESELLDSVGASRVPVVWIGGAEPLLHPEIGHVTRRIVDSGRYVFLETDGSLLRGRVFSFRPVSRLFLTICLHGLEESHDLRAGCPGLFRSAIEGIRTARLSGFLICVQTPVDADTDLQEMRHFNKFLSALDVDGRIVLPAPDSAKEEETKEKVLQTRNLLCSGGWKAFSEILEASGWNSCEGVHKSAEMAGRMEPVPDAYEESVRVP